MRGVPEGDDWKSVRVRLERGGPLYDRMLVESFDERRRDAVLDSQSEAARAKLLALDYDFKAYRHDLLVLEAQLTSAARLIGAEVADASAQVLEHLDARYLAGRGADEARASLVRAIRDWLPFVSLTPYVHLAGEVHANAALPPLPRSPALLPELAALAEGEFDVQDTGRLVDELGSKPRILAAGLNLEFVPWRYLRPDTASDDPRRRVLRYRSPTPSESDATDEVFRHEEEALRLELYQQHPILLVLQVTLRPVDLQAVLAGDAEGRDGELRTALAVALASLEEGLAELRAGLAVAPRQTDWSRFGALLGVAVEFLAEGEPVDSYVRARLADLARAKAGATGARGPLWIASIALVVLLGGASFFVGLLPGLALGAIQLVVVLMASAADEEIARAERRERDKLNRLALIDKSLAVATDDTMGSLGTVLGFVSLGFGLAGLARAAVGSAVRWVRMQHSIDVAARAALDDAAALAAARGPRPAGLPAAEVPPVAVPRASPESPMPEAPIRPAASSAPRVHSLDDLEPLSDVAPMSGTASRRSTSFEPEPQLDPVSVRTKPRKPYADDPEVTAAGTSEEGPVPDMSEFKAAKAHSDELGITAESTDEYADFAAMAAASETRAAEHAAAEAAAFERMASQGAKLEEANERGLALFARRSPDAWFAHLAWLRRMGASEAEVRDVENRMQRGLARLSGQPPEAAARRAAQMRRQQELLAERARLSKARSTESTATPPQGRSTNDPRDLRGTRFSGATRDPDALGVPAMRTQRAVPALAGVVSFEEGAGVRIPDSDLRTAGTGGARRIVYANAVDPDGFRSVTVQGVVLPRGLRRGRSANPNDTRPRALDSNRSHNLASPGEMGLAPGSLEHSHLVGPGAGDEAPMTFLASPQINQLVQNRYVERWMREVARSITSAGGTMAYTIEGVSWNPALLPPRLGMADFLRRVSYELRVSLPGHRPLDIHVDIDVGMPPASRVDSMTAWSSLWTNPSEETAVYSRYVLTRQFDELMELARRTGSAKD